MQFDDSTTRVERTCAEVVLKFPAPFEDGDTIDLTPGLASTLNQVLHENLRNNFATTAKKLKEEGKSGDEIQVIFDKYAAEYEFGVRRIGLRVADPVEAAALDIAEELVKAALRKRGTKLKDLGPKKLRELAVQLIERNPKIRDRAKQQVELTKDLAEEIAV